MSLIALFWFWCWATPVLYGILGCGLEKEYPPLEAGKMPGADAIVILGGGMGRSTKLPYAEMWSSADRVWHAARLYRAGKAPIVIPSGAGEELSALPLLLDLGVPGQAIRVESKARNTEENALLVDKLINSLPKAGTNRPHRVLLVTSAWHMRRALQNFGQTGLEMIPAATDHEAMLIQAEGLKGCRILPSAEMFYRNSMMFKEYLGFSLYRLKYAVCSKKHK
jgi:uncharacterized SAM-binding protein YcdF (DUF218 family)